MRKQIKSTVYDLLSTLRNNSVVGKRWPVDQKGFTIVEVLVVAAVLGVIGYIMSDIIARSLQGSQRTVVIGTAKQNGQVALDTISQAIRNSDLVVCIGNGIPNPTGSVSGDNIVLYGQDGRYVRFRWVSSGGRSYIAQDFPDRDGDPAVINPNPAPGHKYVYEYSTDPSRTSLICSLPTSDPTDSVLTDTDSTNGVLIHRVGGTTPLFTVVKRPGSNDNVTVQFEVRPSLGGGTLPNQLGGSGAAQFHETVQLR